MYEYKIEVLSVVDGDTLDVRLSLGFGVYKVERVRLAGINTPELRSSDIAERERAKRASEFVAFKLLPSKSDKEYIAKTEKPDPRDKYGRFLATIYIKSASGVENLNESLLEAGLAVPYK